MFVPTRQYFFITAINKNVHTHSGKSYILVVLKKSCLNIILAYNSDANCLQDQKSMF